MVKEDYLEGLELGKHVNHYNIGDSKMMNCGMVATIIAKRCYKDIDIQFENGDIVKNKTISEFDKKTIHCPSLKKNTKAKTNRLGETKTMNCGMLAKIIEYKNSNNICVQFKDGCIVKNKRYESFKNGSIVNINEKHNYHNSKRDNRIGLISKNKQGYLIKIVEYKNCDNIIVEFQDEYKFKTKTKYNSFKSGSIMNPYHKTYKSVACIGDTSCFYNYNAKEAYKHWSRMVDRCYGEYKRNKCYKNVSVCDEWLCFENFEKWFDNNYYEIDGEIMVLDKDMLSYKRNYEKEYNPDNCCFIPNEINIKFKVEDRKVFEENRNKYNKYKSSYSSKYLGSFDNLKDAKIEYYLEKTKVYNELAERYKDKIPLKIYEILTKYKGEENE